MIADFHSSLQELRTAIRSSSAPSAWIKKQIVDIKLSVVSQAASPESGFNASQALIELYDSIITEVFARHRLLESDAVCIFALGGYGRREMNLFSDIDINLVYGTTAVPDAIRASVQPFIAQLWDMGLELGHSVRSIEDCVSLALQDAEIRTSLLDAHYIAGDTVTADKFRQAVQNRIHTHDPQTYIQSRIQHMRARHRHHGNSERVLEPDIKEGKGALRDLHTLYWVIQTAFRISREIETSTSHTIVALRTLGDQHILSSDEIDRTEKAADFLMAVRNALHMFAKRRNDRLSYSVQLQLATYFGYQDTPEAKGVEVFMRRYYSEARHISHTCITAIHKLHVKFARPAFDDARLPLENGFYLWQHDGDRTLEFNGDFGEHIRTEPRWMIRIFTLAQKYNATLSDTLQATLREHHYMLDEAQITHREIIRDFLEIWRCEGQIASTLRTMHELTLLEKMVPEFGYIVAHYNYNIYHKYTTDEHLIVAVEALERLFFDEVTRDIDIKHLRQIYEELTLDERYQLYWAVFLHDIGKSRGGDHSEIGVTLAGDIFRRLHYTDGVETIQFLILNHLHMEQTAFRRNLKDSETIQNFVTLIGDRRRLRMLYLLTYADMSAANKNVWTEWKSLLLQELFFRTDDALKTHAGESSEFSTWEELDYAGIVYDGKLSVSFTDREKYTEVIAVTTDAPYRLATLCGALSVCDVSIIDAQIHTREDGIIVDQFRIFDQWSQKPTTDIQKNKIRSILTEVLEKPEELTAHLHRHRDRWKRKKFIAEQPTEIYFEDNRRFTIIDIFAADRIGLLYTITHALSDLGLNIHSAKIGTRLDGVADCFYVTERDGKKIVSVYRQEEIRSKILNLLR
ncbi:MAG TPA: HD domain-containing protein [bacterium]|nr:HD domain-containing protein [bacterium]HNO10782.1 HD domain-containing protein [bacterium]HNO92021.1 HD domain-containing protein [bacterium]